MKYIFIIIRHQVYVHNLDNKEKKMSIKKFIFSSLIIITNTLNAWEINTHRAIDQKAIEKSLNLTSFVQNSNIVKGVW